MGVYGERGMLFKSHFSKRCIGAVTIEKGEDQRTGLQGVVYWGAMILEHTFVI